MRTLLRHILDEPAFLYSDTQIRAPGFPELPARGFFVRFEQINDRLVGEDRGFWGTVISYGWSGGRVTADRGAVRPGADLWLNAGPTSEPSVLISRSQVDGFAAHHRLVDVDDIVGAHVLVLGPCTRSSRGKAYITPATPAHVTFRR